MNTSVRFSPQPKPKAALRKTEYHRKQRQFTNAVWERDQVGGWKGHESAYCVRCKVLVMRGEGGQVDHIKPRSTHPELRYEPSNGRIVCAAGNLWFKNHPLEREVWKPITGSCG